MPPEASGEGGEGGGRGTLSLSRQSSNAQRGRTLH